MKKFYALYDENDNFIDCGFNLREIGIKPTNISWLKRGKKRKLVEIPLSITNDIFAKEDVGLIRKHTNCFHLLK